MRHSTILVVLLCACGGGSSGDDTDSDAGGDDPDANTGPARERIGVVEVVEDLYVSPGEGSDPPSEYRWSNVTARFYDGRPPAFHRETMAAGACTMRVYTPSSCTPACTDGLCVDTNVCEPWPTPVSAGRLTITGARAAVPIDPVDGWYYTQEPLPEDLFDDDAEVTASLAGDALPAMSLDAGGTPPIVFPLPDGKITIPYPAGEDFVLSWTPAGDGSRVRVTLNSNNQGHGQPYLSIIECDVADSAGEVAIPEAMLDAFPETSAWRICAGTDCPPSTIRRYHRDGSPIGDDQEVELVVGSQVSFGVDHILE
jgi:hypothetical protein